MLSQIERSQANPTVAVVWRLANALGVPLTDLLAGAPRAEPPAIVTVTAGDTPALGAADARCRLRILGPIELAGQFEWYELSVKPGGSLASQAHGPGSREHLTVLSGALEVEAGPAQSRLKAGEGPCGRPAPSAIRRAATPARVASGLKAALPKVRMDGRTAAATIRFICPMPMSQSTHPTRPLPGSPWTGW
jgi:transcriptional regulator with XRE-family HTH domain